MGSQAVSLKQLYTHLMRMLEKYCRDAGVIVAHKKIFFYFSNVMFLELFEEITHVVHTFAYSFLPLFVR